MQYISRYLQIGLMLFFSNVICASYNHLEILGFGSDSDSSIIVGLIKENYTSACVKVDNYCMCYSDFLQKGDVAIVIGVYKCTMSYSGPDYFYEVMVKNKAYYVGINSIHFLEGRNYFDELMSLPEGDLAAYREQALAVATALHFDKLGKALEFLSSCKSKGVALLNYHLIDESEYTEGTGIHLEFYNPTAKVIKYITVNFTGYNPVQDKVYNSKSQSYSNQVKIVGPINPEDSGGTDFEYVWFTDLVSTVKITSINVQYMDGTSKVISDIKSITLSKDLYDYLKE